MSGTNSSTLAAANWSRLSLHVRVDGLAGEHAGEFFGQQLDRALDVVFRRLFKFSAPSHSLPLRDECRLLNCKG